MVNQKTTSMAGETLSQNYAGVFDGQIGFGDRPAIIVVDFIRAYTRPGSPLFAEDVVKAVRSSKALLAQARKNNRPIIFTKVLYSENGLVGGIFVKKVPLLRTLVEGNPDAEIVPELGLLPNELVIAKKYASAFFGTSLASTLTALGVDTVVVIGCSTSGCVRATAVDAMQNGFRVIVPEECVGDRAPEPHFANLFDINSKYGDVLPLAMVLVKI